eukprot:7391444-Prymnesium_polylepis.1
MSVVLVKRPSARCTMPAGPMCECERSSDVSDVSLVASRAPKLLTPASVSPSKLPDRLRFLSEQLILSAAVSCLTPAALMPMEESVSEWSVMFDRRASASAQTPWSRIFVSQMASD